MIMINSVLNHLYLYGWIQGDRPENVILLNWFILLQGNRYTLTQLFNTNLNAIEKLTI